MMMMSLLSWFSSIMKLKHQFTIHLSPSESCLGFPVPLGLALNAFVPPLPSAKPCFSAQDGLSISGRTHTCMPAAQAQAWDRHC